MQKQKSKKWIKRILITILASLTVVISAPILANQFSDTTAYAQTPSPATTQPTCPAGFTVNNGKCFSATAATCPDGYDKDTNAAGVTGTYCTPKTVVAGMVFDQQAKNAMQFLIWIQKTANGLLWPVLVFIGGLMDNSLLFGNGMEVRLREIWIPIRNIVNILFVIALVAIALYNVLGIGEEGNYSIKAMLPKLIIGIIVVNFSFLGMKVFLDGINVLTSAVFALPDQVSEGTATVLNSANPKDKDAITRFCKLIQGKDVSSKITDEEIKKEADLAIRRIIAKEYELEIPSSITDSTEFDQKVEEELGDENFIEMYEDEIAEREKGRICYGLELSDHGKAFFGRFGQQNMALAMALNMGKIVYYQDIPLETYTIEKLFLNHVFSMLLYIVFAASFIVLFVVLLARLVLLWVAIVLSPVLLLAMTVPVVKEKLGFGTITEKFIGTAIAPLGIAVCMTVGWIMLNAIGNIDFIKEGALQFDIATLPVAKASTLQDLIVMLGTVAVVWMGVFAAADKSIAKVVTDQIKNGLVKAGTFVGTLPLKHMPLIPVDIPGAEQKRWTLEQVKEAIHGIGDSGQKKYKLKELITGEKTRSPEWLRTQAGSANDVRNFAKYNKNSIENGINSLHYQALAKLRTDGRTKALFDKLGLKEKEAIEKMERAKTKEASIEAAKEFLKLAVPLAQGEAAAAQETQPIINPSDPATDTELESKITDRTKREEVMNKLNTTLIELSTAVGAKKGKDDLTKIIEKLKDSNYTSQIRDVKRIGDDRYKTLIETLGEKNVKKGEEKLTKILTEPPTPPPAPTAAPAAKPAAGVAAATAPVAAKVAPTPTLAAKLAAPSAPPTPPPPAPKGKP